METSRRPDQDQVPEQAEEAEGREGGQGGEGGEGHQGGAEEQGESRQDLQVTIKLFFFIKIGPHFCPHKAPRQFRLVALILDPRLLTHPQQEREERREEEEEEQVLRGGVLHLLPGWPHTGLWRPQHGEGVSHKNQ